MALGLYYSTFSRVFIDNVLLAQRLDWLPYILLGMLLSVILQGVLTALQLRYLRTLRVKLAVGMSSRFVWHLLHLPIGFYSQRFAGEITARIELNNQVADILSGRLITTVISLVMVVFYAIAMAQYDIPLTLIVVAFAAINVGVLQWVSRQRTDANRRLVQEYGLLLSGVVAPVNLPCPDLLLVSINLGQVRFDLMVGDEKRSLARCRRIRLRWWSRKSCFSLAQCEKTYRFGTRLYPKRTCDRLALLGPSPSIA